VTKGTSVVRMTSVIPAAAMMSPVAKERSAKKVTSVEPMEYVTPVASTSLAQVISATRVTTMTMPLVSAINTVIWATAVGRETVAMGGLNALPEYALIPLRSTQLQAYLSVKKQKQEQVSQAEIGAIGMPHIGKRIHRYVTTWDGPK